LVVEQVVDGDDGGTAENGGLLPGLHQPLEEAAVLAEVLRNLLDRHIEPGRAVAAAPHRSDQTMSDDLADLIPGARFQGGLLRRRRGFCLGFAGWDEGFVDLPMGLGLRLGRLGGCADRLLVRFLGLTAGVGLLARG
jgi:hypothetical protein